MKLTTSTLVIPLAALLLVGGAGAVLAATADPAPKAATTLVLDAGASIPSPAPSSGPVVGPAIQRALDGLVTKGTITADQEAAIIEAVASARADRRGELVQLRGFLSDGVLTQSELSQLPADSPFQKLSGLMTDGQVTVAQLRAFGRGVLRDLVGAGLGRGAMMGGQGGRGLGGGLGIGPVATATPAP